VHLSCHEILFALKLQRFSIITVIIRPNMKKYFFFPLFKLKSSKSYGLPVLCDRKRTANSCKLVEADINIKSVITHRTLQL